ncbi:MAG TPA: preprotein translocase subunit SecE [Rhizomicrobium sp.]|nr:preprotein translocase subunit SecE [Rhizomicrobium sp.]
MAEVTKRTSDAGDDGAPPARRVGMVEFFQQVRREMKKVTWPSWKETWLTTLMVFIMVGLTMVFFFVVDTVLAYGERLLIGAAG